MVERNVYDPAVDLPPQRIGVTKSGKLFVAFPYDAAMVELARQVPGRWWDRDSKLNLAELTPLAARRAMELFPAFPVSAALAKRLAEWDGREAVKADFANAPQPGWIAVDLFPFQRAGVAFLRTLDNALLTDAMGLGKTLQAIAWASAPERRGPTVVVCPASVKFFWEREIKRARPDDCVVVVNGKVSVPPAGAAEWVVLNYDLLKKNLDALKAFGVRSLILDEAHYVKHRGAQRTKAALALREAVSGGCLPMTGTPIDNRPVELWNLLLLARRKREKEFFLWAKRFCGAQQKYCGRSVGYRWDFSGASNLGELHESLKPFTLRRQKKDVLPELPEIIYSDERVALENGAAAEYGRAMTDFRAWYASKGRTAGVVEHLQQLAALRQLAVRGKVEGLLERLEAFREEGRKAIVFSCFNVEGIDRLAAGLKPEEFVRVTGEENAEQRQAAVDRFQADPACLFALCNVVAGGVGITLTAADQVIFLDQPWTPGQYDQAVSRAHRIGQTRGVVATNLIGRGTVDEAMLAVRLEKARIVAQAVDGAASAVAEGDVAREVSGRLAEGGSG